MDNQNKKTKKPVDLASLYPRAKTYDEIEEHQQAVELRRQKRQPRNIPFWASINMSFIALAVIAGSTSDALLMIFVGNIPGAFLLGLMCAIFVWWQAGRLSDFFAQKGYTATPFLLTYFISVVPLLKACYTWLTTVMSSIAAYAPIMLINMALINLLAAVVITKRLSNVQKITVLSLVVVASVVFAIFSAI